MVALGVKNGRMRDVRAPAMRESFNCDVLTRFRPFAETKGNEGTKRRLAALDQDAEAIVLVHVTIGGLRAGKGRTPPGVGRTSGVRARSRHFLARASRGFASQATRPSPAARKIVDKYYL
jgi:hypothetical protein